jgi:hypothetical protein
MKRVHFVEIEDQPWCPAAVRRAATDYLRFAAKMNRVYDGAVPILRRAIERAGAERVLDLCSGGGGPWIELRRALADGGAPVRVVLTDFHPNTAAFEHVRAESEGAIEYVPEPVDATRVPAGLSGFRTLFGSFHHFRPEQAKSILRDAVDNGQGIAVFEATERRPLVVAAMFLTPLVVLLVTPMIRPFSWSRLFWTYLVPAVPFLVLFDGVVSCLRTYTPDELRELTSGLSEGGYTWEAGQAPIPKAPVAMTYLVGAPARAARPSPAD